MLNVGIGLTSKCNCNCKHCYSRVYGNDEFLNKEELIKFFACFDIGSVNFGTGESYFHPDYIDIIHYLHDRGIKVSVTTNGYTISKMTDEQLVLLHDVDFSLDYPVEKLHDKGRQEGCFQLVKNGIERCKKLGITTSIAWCLTPDNCDYIKEMYALCKKWDIFLRINIYKPTDKKRGFSYGVFWKSINELFKWGDIISVSEGIVNAAIENPKNFTGCTAKNLRIFPDGSISSCVYVANKELTLEKACEMTEEQLLIYFSSQYELAENNSCSKCLFFEKCKAGCLARRRIANLEKDEFCYIDREERPQFERIVFSKQKSDLFIHSNYLCTFIMEPREKLS